MKRICPICGESYNEPPALSRIDNHTEICSSCGIRQSIEPLLKAGVMDESEVEEIVAKNKELYRTVNGT